MATSIIYDKEILNIKSVALVEPVSQLTEITADYTASQIANWFLIRNRIAITDADAEYITNMKLQKLLYYAQGVHLAITGKPLFRDPMHAWRHGPVVESVYHAYKAYGSNGIDQDGYDLPDISSEAEGILEQVYTVFGQYSAWKLREMTHREAPWQAAGLGGQICLNLMGKYFSENHVDE